MALVTDAQDPRFTTNLEPAGEEFLLLLLLRHMGAPNARAGFALTL